MAKLTKREADVRARRLDRVASLVEAGKDSKQIARNMRLTVPQVVGLKRSLLSRN